LTASGWQSTEGSLVGISFVVDRTNYRELPQLLAFCIANGIPQLVLPISRAHQTGDPLSYLDGAKREILSRGLHDIGRPHNVQLTIHDPFLWQVFYPDKPFPESGCQAANSMLYIAPDATVYPCPALPFKLGSLLDTTLAQISASQIKRNLRLKLLDSPEECRSCTELPQCLGGCRGRGYVLQGSCDAADPACR
jgi:GeoRSP system SPASM domain protein